MVKWKLKTKLVVGSAGIIVFLLLISIIVAALIINNQNRVDSEQRLQQAMNIFRKDVTAMQEKFLENCHQMAKMNDMGAKVQFIAEEKDGSDPLLTQPTYQDALQTIFNIARTANIGSIALYAGDGDLLGFVSIAETEATIGYPQRTPQKHFEIIRIKPGEELHAASWQKEPTPGNIDIPFSMEIPMDTVAIQPVGEYICLVARVAIQALVFDAQKEALEPGQIGFIVAAKRFDQNFVEQTARFSGVSLNIFRDHTFSVGSLPEYRELIAAPPPVISKEWRFIEQDFLFEEITVENNGYFQSFLPVFVKGQMTGGIAALYPKSIAYSRTLRMIIYLTIASCLCICLILPVTYFFSNSLLRPMMEVVHGLKNIAEGEGDLTNRLQITTEDEIGDLSKWFNTFISRLHRIISDIAADSVNLKDASMHLSKVSGNMSKVIEAASLRSDMAAKSAEQMSDNMTGVASAMEQTSVNTAAVTSSTDELTSTIQEIARQSDKARDVSGEAVNEAKNAVIQVGELGHAADEIGKVTETITEISEQTNLLALNATIEAARAGEAGKGFAVVANEIKELAKQTAASTTEIKGRITGIQASTDMIVRRIEIISRVIHEVNDIVSGIAAAIEEQSATTNEIAENVSQASRGIQSANQNISKSSEVAIQIFKDIASVNMATGEMSDSSLEVSTNAQDLLQLALRLQGTVGRFKL